MTKINVFFEIKYKNLIIKFNCKPRMKGFEFFIVRVGGISVRQPKYIVVVCKVFKHLKVATSFSGSDGRQRKNVTELKFIFIR